MTAWKQSAKLAEFSKVSMDEARCVLGKKDVNADVQISVDPAASRPVASSTRSPAARRRLCPTKSSTRPPVAAAVSKGDSEDLLVQKN